MRFNFLVGPDKANPKVQTLVNRLFKVLGFTIDYNCRVTQIQLLRATLFFTEFITVHYDCKR